MTTALTGRSGIIEDHQSPTSKAGSEVGASQIPVVDSLQKTVTGTSVTGESVNRKTSAATLGVELLLVGLGIKAELTSRSGGSVSKLGPAPRTARARPGRAGLATEDEIHGLEQEMKAIEVKVKRGQDAELADAEADAAYLASPRHGEAGTIHLKENPTRVDLAEESLHAYQDYSRGYANPANDLEAAVWQAEDEVLAQQELLRRGQAGEFTSADQAQTEQALQHWESELEAAYAAYDKWQAGL